MKAFKNWNNNKKVESVALKMIQTQNWDSQYAKPKDMMKEVDIQGSLNHPSLVKIKEVIFTVDRMVLVMELVKGGDLFDQINSGGDRPRVRSEMEVKVQFYQVAHCVRYLHRENISHRDLKLENILISSSSSNRVKITDFGLAKVTCFIHFLLFNINMIFEGVQLQHPPQDLRRHPVLHGAGDCHLGEEGVSPGWKLQSEGRLLVPGCDALHHASRLLCLP